ncbi:hypothetical protein [Planctomicrobium sp. SH527]|uniref:hypothetical protein n=1 Tax=Planctomicrobium sp. SH527 TaxID=3448123 RepID=UPI003F5CB3BA
MSRPLAPILVACLMLTLIALTGCTHTYSQPYGYGGYSGYQTYPQQMGAPYQQAPIQTLTPGQPYVPGGAVYPNAMPQGVTPTFQNPGTGTGLQPIPDNSTNAPTFNPNTSPKAPDPYFNSTSITPAVPNVSAMPVNRAPAQSPLAPPVGNLRELNSMNTPTSAGYVPVPAGLPVNAAPLAQPMPMAVTSAPVDSFATPKMGPLPGRPLDPAGNPAATSTGRIEQTSGTEPLWDLKAN